MRNVNEYKLLVPAKADFYEEYARQEFVALYKMATGKDILTVTDEVVFVDGAKVISLGRTNLLKESRVTAEYEKLGRDGYRIVTEGDTVFLVGGGTYGTVYAVYGFLARLLGYKFYNPEEIYFANPKNEEIEDMDITDIPDFENRTGGWHYSRKESAWAIRYRTFKYFGEMADGEEFFGSWAHNHIREYLPTSKYLGKHPDWYSPEFTQLCLSNEEMWPEFTNRVIERIKERPRAEFFLLGQEDRPTFCGCPRCLALIEKIGRSGVMMRFVNYVAREVEKWRKENAPDRHILVGTFAYQKTQTPPVTQDENGNYIPVDPSVVPEDNVFIMLAPISADCSVTMTDPERNPSAKKTIEGWYSLTHKCILWTYCSNFDRKFGFFDNFHVLSDNYKIFRNYQFRWLYYENNATIGGTALQPLLCYLHSNLAWNADFDVKEGTVDFMKHYYKEGADAMIAYLKGFNDFYKARKKEYSERDNIYYGTYLWNGQEKTSVLDPNFHTWEFICEREKNLDDAEKAIKLARYNKEREQKYLKRILIERMTVKFLIAQFFGHKFESKAKYVEYLDKFRKEVESFEMVSIKRNQTLDATFDQWKEDWCSGKGTDLDIGIVMR